MKKIMIVSFLLLSILLSGCNKLSDTQKDLKTCIDTLITKEPSDTCDTATLNSLVGNLALEVSSSLDFNELSIEVAYANLVKDYFMYTLNFNEVALSTMSIEDMFDISKELYKAFDEVLDITQISIVSFHALTNSYTFTASDVYFNFTSTDDMSNLLIYKDSLIKDVLDTSIIDFGNLTIESKHYSIHTELDFVNKTFTDLEITALTADASMSSLETKTLVEDYLITQGFVKYL